MAHAQVLRIECPVASGEKEESFILLHIRRLSGQKLDIELLASEGSTVFSLNVTSDNVGSYKAKNFSGSDDDWERIIAQVLLPHQSINGTSADATDVEMTAELGTEELHIKLRRKTSGIAQHLGAFRLSRNEALEEDISVFGWAGIAARETKDLRGQLHESLLSRNSLERQTVDLERQLKELQDAKKQTERSMLQKFREVLNEKKLKIRDQSRLLSGAMLNADAAASMQSMRGDSRSRTDKPKEARPDKRKAVNHPAGPSSVKHEDDSDIEMGKDDASDEQYATDFTDRGSPLGHSTDDDSLSAAQNDTREQADKDAKSQKAARDPGSGDEDLNSQSSTIAAAKRRNRPSSTATVVAERNRVAKSDSRNLGAKAVVEKRKINSMDSEGSAKEDEHPDDDDDDDEL